MGMPQDVISPLSSFHGMYLERDQRHSLRGLGVYILENHVARERIAGLEGSHIEMNVDIKR